MAIILLVFIAADAAGADEGGKRSLKGRVRGNDDGLPLTGALIELSDGSGSVRSDWNGAFSMTIAASPVSLKIALTGFEAEVREIAAGVEDVYLDIVLLPEIVEMEDVSVTAEAYPAVQVRSFDAEKAETIPTGGDPGGVALALAQVNDYSGALGGAGIDAYPGDGGQNPLRSYSPGVVYYGADPSWAASLWDYIPIPRTMHFLGYPSPESVVPRGFIGETEVYDLVSPLRYGSSGSGVIRFVPAELETLASAGASVNSAALQGGYLGEDQGVSGGAHKSLFEYFVFPLEDADRKNGSNLPFASSNYGKVKGNGGAALRYGNSMIEGVRLGMDALAFYDSGAIVSKNPADGRIADGSHVFEGVDSFAAMGLEGEAALSSSLSLNVCASLGYMLAAAEERYRENARNEYLIASERDESLRAGGHADLRLQPCEAAKVEVGANYEFQWSSRELFNNQYLAWEPAIIDSLRPRPSEDPSAEAVEWNAVSHTIDPYAQASWNGDDWGVAASVGALLQPDRSLYSALADARFDARFLDGAADLSLQLGLRSEPLSAFRMAEQAMFLDVDGYGIGPADTQQKVFSSGLTGSWRSGIHEASLGGYFRYFFDLSGYNLQSWYPRYTATSNSTGGDAYYPSSDFSLPQPDQGRSFGGNVEYSGEYGQYGVTASYSFSDTRYHSALQGWVRANTDVRHVLKASFLYKPNQVFFAATNISAHLDTPFTPIVMLRDEFGTLVPAAGAPNAGSDFMPRVKLDVALSYRFSFGKGTGRVYLDTCNLLALLNREIIGLKAGARDTEGSSTADYMNRVYGPSIKGFTLLGTNAGIEIKY